MSCPGPTEHAGPRQARMSPDEALRLLRDAETAELQQDHTHVLSPSVLNENLTLRDGSKPNEAACLDVIWRDTEFPAAEGFHTMNGESVGSNSFDASAENIQKVGQVLYVRL